MPTKNNSRASFPSKRSFQEVDKILKSDEVSHLGVTTRSGESLAEVPIKVRPKRLIPRVFHGPAKALGVGISTVSRLLGLRVEVETSKDTE